MRKILLLIVLLAGGEKTKAADPFEDAPNVINRTVLEQLEWPSLTTDNSTFQIMIRANQNEYKIGQPIWVYCLIAQRGRRTNDNSLTIDQLPFLGRLDGFELKRGGKRQEVNHLLAKRTHWQLPTQRDDFCVVRADLSQWVMAGGPGNYTLQWKSDKYHSNVLSFAVAEPAQGAAEIGRQRVHFLRPPQWLAIDSAGEELDFYGSYASFEPVLANPFAAELACGLEGSYYVDILDLPQKTEGLQIQLRGLDENDELVAKSDRPTTLEVQFTSRNGQTTLVMPRDVFLCIRSQPGGMFRQTREPEIRHGVEYLVPYLEPVAPGKPLSVRIPFPKQATVPVGNAKWADISVIVASSKVEASPGLRMKSLERFEATNRWSGVLSSNAIRVAVPDEWHQEWPAVPQQPKEILEQ